MRTTADLASFQEYKHRFNNPYALYEYMGVKPSRSGLQAFMNRCDALRRHGAKLSKKALESERRAYSDLLANNCVEHEYKFERLEHLMNGVRRGHVIEDLDAWQEFEQKQQREWFGK